MDINADITPESNIQQYKEYLNGGNGRLVNRIKRPIILDNVSPNDIYITRRIPLCVYYKRAISLLRQQLVYYMCQSDTAISDKISIDTNVELYRLIQERSYNLKGLVDADESWGTRGIRIHAAGACIKSAFYLLQDILDHYHQLLQSKNELYLLQKPKKKSERFGQPPQPEGDLSLLEEKISKFLNVKITSDSLLCTDDLYIKNDSSNGYSIPINNFDTDGVQHVENSRYISTVTIEMHIDM